MMIPHEVLAIVGIGVIGFIGNTVLLNMGQKTLSICLDIVLSIAAAIIGLKFFWSGAKEVAALFHIML